MSQRLIVCLFLTLVLLTGSLLCVADETIREVPSDQLVPQANLSGFEKFVAPVFEASCVSCHGPKKSKGNFRIDELDPNLLTSADIDRWVEVYEVLSNSEMPPDDEPEYHLKDQDRARVVDWLGGEMNKASLVRRNEGGHTSFRRMANYEYNYALQDLLGLDLEFTEGLPPENFSEDGFKNSSELLQISAMQFETYREIALSALKKATVSGEQPAVVTYQIPMMEAMDKAAGLKPKPFHKADSDYADKRKRTHIFNKETGEGVFYRWTYYVVLDGEAHHGIWNLKPDTEISAVPPVSGVVAVLPRSQKMRLDLGNSVPDGGTMRVRVRAGASSYQADDYASLRLVFGFQTNNEGKMSAEVSHFDVPVIASLDDPQFISFDIPLNAIPRNPFRKLHEVGSSPNVTEFLEIQNVPNAGVSKGAGEVDIEIDYVEVEAGFYKEWPPKSHSSIFGESPNRNDERRHSGEVLKTFISRAWRRPVNDDEVNAYVDLFLKFRPSFASFEEAMIEVLATVLAAPEFLYIVQGDIGGRGTDSGVVNDLELANRLSFFLWSSIPDSELLALAIEGKLRDPETLMIQVERLLADSRSKRFSKNFVEQWLGLEGLETVIVDRKKFKNFDDELKEDILEEPLKFFEEVLSENHSMIDFLHSDYLVVNETVARHYGIPDVYGQKFRKVAIGPGVKRGGLLTTAAVMTLNSTGVDSNPLKRGVWLLERILHDPPPPPPPNVPEVDLTDPRILSMSQKERMADHRNQAACRSCHAKIDPWGIALENYDAIGAYRLTIRDQPVDATAVLYNQKRLDGVESLKEYLLSKRQDQFAKAMVHKLSAYALGRPMTFTDRAEIDKITMELKKRGYGMKDLVSLLIQSKLFRTKITEGAEDE